MKDIDNFEDSMHKYFSDNLFIEGKNGGYYLGDKKRDCRRVFFLSFFLNPIYNIYIPDIVFSDF
jgi:hypothetical protein